MRCNCTATTQASSVCTFSKIATQCSSAGKKNATLTSPVAARSQNLRIQTSKAKRRGRRDRRLEVAGSCVPSRRSVSRLGRCLGARLLLVFLLIRSAGLNQPRRQAPGSQKGEIAIGPVDRPKVQRNVESRAGEEGVDGPWSSEWSRLSSEAQKNGYQVNYLVPA